MPSFAKIGLNYTDRCPMSDGALELNATNVVLQSLESAMKAMWKVKTWSVGANNGLELDPVKGGQYLPGNITANKIKDLVCVSATGLVASEITAWPYAEQLSGGSWRGTGASLICLGLVVNSLKEIIGTAWRGSLGWEYLDSNTGEALVGYDYSLASGTFNEGSFSFEFYPADGEQGPYILTLTPSSYWNFS